MGAFDGLPSFFRESVAEAVGGAGYHQRREQAAQAWAASVGWTYLGADPALATRWSGAPFGEGTRRWTTEVVTGPFRGRPAVSFGYRYTSPTPGESGESTTTFHVLATRMPVALPTVELTPDGAGARIAKSLGGEDHDTESDAFNRTWRVEAADPRFAHAVVHPRLMERLMWPDARGMHLRIEGADILSRRPGMPDMSTATSRLEVLAAVVDAIPPFVWQEHGYDPART